MSFIIKHTRWLMLGSGVLTATMFYGLFAPQAALESMFGASFDGVLESLLVRSWSALVGLMGLILIYGGLVKSQRSFVLAIAACSKLVFVVLMLLYGQAFLAKAGPAIVMDILVVLVAGAYLFAVYRRRPPDTQ